MPGDACTYAGKAGAAYNSSGNEDAEYINPDWEGGGPSDLDGAFFLHQNNLMPKVLSLAPDKQDFVISVYYTYGGDIKQFTSLNEQQILNKLKFGQGPLLEIVDLPGAYGYHNPLTNTVKIDINYVKKLENSTGANAEIMNLFLSITLLHEFVHWTDGLFFNWTQESGESWEIATYGFIVDTSNVKLIKN